jgi:hypothetical protein
MDKHSTVTRNCCHMAAAVHAWLPLLLCCSSHLATPHHATPQEGEVRLQTFDQAAANMTPTDRQVRLQGAAVTAVTCSQKLLLNPQLAAVC